MRHRISDQANRMIAAYIGHAGRLTGSSNLRAQIQKSGQVSISLFPKLMRVVLLEIVGLERLKSRGKHDGRREEWKAQEFARAGKEIRVAFMPLRSRNRLYLHIIWLAGE